MKQISLPKRWTGWPLTLLLFAFIAALVYSLACTGNNLKPKAMAFAAGAPPPSCACNPSDGFNVLFDSIVPGDNLNISNQMDADCFAWQEFVALNWPTTPGAMFGAPNDYEPVQWETYMSTALLFLPNGAAPPPWGSLTQAPKALGINGPIKVLMDVSKTDSAFVLDEISQAAPFNAPNWLGAQNGTNLWYEVLVNYDEYQYITDPAHQFYNADKQFAWVTAGKPIVFPNGSSAATGAIEIKAAWMEVTDLNNPRWSRYKLSKAALIDPVSGKSRLATVALVGLHILHKMESQPTWFWATFEHVDNLPGSNGSQSPYNFYNPDCASKTLQVSPQCAADSTSTSVTVGCQPNIAPPYYLCAGGPGPVPIQVTRLTPLDATNAIPVNDTMQAAIGRYFPKSVWQNYQLVNALWSTSPNSDPLKPVIVPAKVKSMTPSSPVANPVLETYIQNNTCTSCHMYATIAPTASDPSPDISSNFSFVLQMAKPSPGQAIKKRK